MLESYIHDGAWGDLVSIPDNECEKWRRQNSGRYSMLIVKPICPHLMLQHFGCSQWLGNLRFSLFSNTLSSGFTVA